MQKKEKRYNYFEAFLHMAEKASEAAEKLATILRNFDPKRVEHHILEMHEIEHGADSIHHEILKRLAREFITPIEREDIILMAGELDEVVDKIEDVAQRIYMYNLTVIPQNAIAMAEVVEQCCHKLIDACGDFAHFQHNRQKLRESIIEINKLEEDGDLLYLQGVRNLFMGEENAVTVLAWESTYTRLEKCCDACEHVADVIESIIMKNS